MIDALACEPHFLDHLAPVWHALPDRGRFLVERRLIDRAARLGIGAEPIDANAIRSSMAQQPPRHDGRPALIASIGDAKVGRRMGYGPFIFLEHGAGQAYDSPSPASASYAGGPDRDDHELVLVPNAYAASHWRRSYPTARIETVGCPKLETLPRREPGPGPGPVVAISFHWPVSPSISSYAGTASGDYLPALGELLREDWTVIGHQHPNWLGRQIPGAPSRIYGRLGIEFVPDFEDVCRRADVYVCDNSSTIFEFAATGRPVVVLNRRDWSRKAGPGLRFWDAAHVGVNCDRPRDLVASIREALADSEGRRRDREDALDFVYQPLSGGAELAAAAIAGWLGDRARRVA